MAFRVFSTNLLLFICFWSVFAVRPLFSVFIACFTRVSSIFSNNLVQLVARTRHTLVYLRILDDARYYTRTLIIMRGITRGNNPTTHVDRYIMHMHFLQCFRLCPTLCATLCADLYRYNYSYCAQHYAGSLPMMCAGRHIMRVQFGATLCADTACNAQRYVRYIAPAT